MIILQLASIASTLFVIFSKDLKLIQNKYEASVGTQ